VELQLRMPAVQVQFVFLQQTAAGRRKIAEAEQEQLAGSGRASMLPSMTNTFYCKDTTKYTVSSPQASVRVTFVK